MNKIFGLALGILAAIGGFVDIDLVFALTAIPLMVLTNAGQN